MELRQYLSVLRSRWLLILLSTVLAAGVGFTLSGSETRYTATATLYIGDQPKEVLNASQFVALDRVLLTFSTMIESREFATRALREVQLDRDADDVVQATEVGPEPGTQLLYINVTDADAAVAQSLANALAQGFVDGIQEFEPGAQDEGNRLPAYVFEQADLPTVPNPTSQLRSTLLATLFGLIAGAGLVFLLDYLDVSLRTAADVERRLELPVLGVIPVLSTEAPFTARVSSAASRDRGKS